MAGASNMLVVAAAMMLISLVASQGLDSCGQDCFPQFCSSGEIDFPCDDCAEQCDPSSARSYVDCNVDCGSNHCLKFDSIAAGDCFYNCWRSNCHENAKLKAGKTRT